MTFLWGFAVGLIGGYIFANIKMWESILQSWTNRDIRLKLSGEAVEPPYELGWLEGHREIVRVMDQSVWSWMVNRRKAVQEVLREKEDRAL